MRIVREVEVMDEDYLMKVEVVAKGCLFDNSTLRGVPSARF